MLDGRMILFEARFDEPDDVPGSGFSNGSTADDLVEDRDE